MGLTAPSHGLLRQATQTTRQRAQHNLQLPYRCTLRRNAQTEQRKEAAQLSETPQYTERLLVGIPGPSWLMTGIRPLGAPFRAYGRASTARPYVTQVISSLVVYFCGDMASQYIQQRGESPDAPGAALVEKYDSSRSIRSLIIGSISSIPSYLWFIYLSTHLNLPAAWPYSHWLSLAYKITINQTFFTPIFNSYFFGMHSLLSGQGGPTEFSEDASVKDVLAIPDRLSAAWQRITLTVPTSWVNSWKFWPFVTAFSFTLIPIRHRSVFAGCMAVGWQSYLGIVNQRAARTKPMTDIG